MITSLRIQNFLSFRDVAVELRQRNVLVGPNMSGKSNFIECLRFLTSITLLGVKQTFLNRDGFKEVVWKGMGNRESQISIVLTAEVPVGLEGERRRYDYQITVVGSPTGAYLVEQEKLTVKKGDRDVLLVNLRSGAGEFLHLDGTPAVRTPIDSDKSALELNIPGWDGSPFRQYISLWHFYRLVPALMKRYNDAKAQYFLTDTGDNLSSWLLTLQTGYPEAFKRIRQVSVDSLPGLEEIFTPPTPIGTTVVSTKERDLSRPISIWRMSDGELVFLALLSLIFAPAELGSPVVCIEEPENHLHPKLIETLVEVYDQRRAELGARGAQVFLTTHSPYLIDKMSLEDMLVLQKTEGATQFRVPASKSHLRELLAKEEAGLGDLWYSGALSEP